MLSKFAKFLEYKNLLVQLLVIFIKCDHFISEDYNVGSFGKFFLPFFFAACMQAELVFFTYFGIFHSIMTVS